MRKRKINIATLLFSLAILVAVHADGQILTVVPEANFNASSDLRLEPGNTQALKFNLGTLTRPATIQSCTLLLTVKTPPTNKITFDLQLADSSTYPAPLVSNKPRVKLFFLDKKVKADSVLALPIDSLFLKENLWSTLKFNLVYFSDAAGSCEFYNAAANLGKRPRLVIRYKQPGAAQAEWSQVDANPMRDRQLSTEFVGAMPKSFRHGLLANLQNVGAPLLYRGSLYVLNQDLQNRTSLLAIDPLGGGQSVVETDLPAVMSGMSIDPFGGLYLTNANKSMRIDLNSKTKLDPVVNFGGNTALDGPTIGRDGSLYYAMSDAVWAYSPYPNHHPLWKYSTGAKTGMVSLHRDGKTAYFVTYRNNVRAKDSLLVIDAICGQRIAAVAVDLVMDANALPPTPLVTESGTIYLTNHSKQATTLYAFTKNLKELWLKNTPGSIISQPVPKNTVSLQDNEVFFVLAGGLWLGNPEGQKSISITRATLPKTAVKSLISDRQNRLYLTMEQNKLEFFALHPDGANYECINAIVLDMSGSAFQGKLILGRDGAAYATTSSKIYRFRPEFAENRSYLATDKQKDFRTYQCKTFSIPNSLSIRASQVWVGSEGVSIGTNVTLEPSSSIVIESGGGISFGKNFKVSQGATLHCKSGY